jgi:hypothetical protein
MDNIGKSWKECQLRFIFILISIFLLPFEYSFAAASSCHSELWPAESVLTESFSKISQSTKDDLQRLSNKLLSQKPYPVQTLGLKNKTLQKKYKDEDNSAILALSYYLTHEEKYLNKAKDILLSWSHINKPTGNPIEESRLEGMIWAYDLISCHLTGQENAIIKNWFNQIRIRKLAWKFGVSKNTTSQKIYQYKILLLLDKVLSRRSDLQTDVRNLEKYSRAKRDAQTGILTDHLERSALYYHNYVLQPWLEIIVISGCCRKPEEKTIQYSQLDVSKTASAIVMYYTLDSTNPNEALWTIRMRVPSVSRLTPSQ